jgi:hypothetical protein
MRKAAVLVCLAGGVLGFLILSPGAGLTRDSVLVAMIACMGVYAGWSLPLGDG